MAQAGIVESPVSISALELRSALFCSDVHLCESRPGLTAVFLDWLRQQTLQSRQPPQALLILGDLFDAWVGDDLLDHRQGGVGRQVCETLREIHDKGVMPYVMHGNRDFLIGDRFFKESGAIHLADPARLMIPGGVKIALAHGDAQCTQDADYQAFRQQVRGPEWQSAFLARPIEERLQIAAELRLQSETEKSVKSMMLMDVQPEDCESLTEVLTADLLLHGHTHRPGCTTMSNGKARWVLPDWETNASGQRIRGGGLWADASGIRPLL